MLHQRKRFKILLKLHKFRRYKFDFEYFLIQKLFLAKESKKERKTEESNHVIVFIICKI